MKDYYGTLNISRDATHGEIKKAYFRLVRTFPPERHPEEFMRIREAYEVLVDQHTRREYDLVDSMPDVVRMWFNEGRKALDEGQPGNAICLLEQITREYPDFSVVNCLLGDAYLENGNSNKAIRMFEKLVAQDSNNAAFMRRLARAYAIRGWNRKAVDQYRRALSLDEDNISLWMGLINCYLATHEYELAQETVFEGLAVSNRNGWDNLELYYFIIQIDIFTRNFTGMKKHLAEMQNKAVEKEEEKANVAWFLATLAKKIHTIGLHEEASVTIDAAFALLPDDAELTEIKKEITAEAGLQLKLKELKEGASIDSRLGEMLEFELQMCNDPSCTECAVTQYLFEMNVIMELVYFRKEILKLKKSYPELYALKKEFFITVLNRKKEEHLCNTYYKKHEKFIKLHPEKFGIDDDDEEYDGKFYSDYDEDDEDEYSVPQPYKRQEPKVGRNAPCPCGSGKKYKKCCG